MAARAATSEATLTRVDGHAERVAAKAMIGKARQANPEAAINLGADKGYDAAAEEGRLECAGSVMGEWPSDPSDVQ
jgi:hypothetical protein